MIWNTIVIISKSIMFELEVLLSEPLIQITSSLLGWIQPYKTLELILVIIIVPVIMNGFAFWFQDNFLMKKETPVPTEEGLAPPEAETNKEEARTTGAEPAPVEEPRPDVHELLL